MDYKFFVEKIWVGILGCLGLTVLIVIFMYFGGFIHIK